MKPLVCAIGVSRKDVELAKTWLRWVSVLNSMTPKTMKLVVCYTRDTYAVDLQAMSDARGCMIADFAPIPDLHETGYPGSASHLFLRTMEHCEHEYPGHPVLWVEADAIPMHPNWFHAIEEEYQSCGAPFMGHLELNVTPPHMAGVAVYPPDWRARAPRLAKVMQAPDLPRQWGRGKGQAFDTYAAPDVLPQAVQAKTIQQIWNPPIWSEKNLHLIREQTALFHQCKTGGLIKALMNTRLEGWRNPVAA